MKLLIVQNYWTPYRNALFNHLAEKVELEVIYLSPVDEQRKWRAENSAYPHRVLPARRFSRFVISKFPADFRVDADMCVLPEIVFNVVSILQIKKQVERRGIPCIIWSGEARDLPVRGSMNRAIANMLKHIFRKRLYKSADRFWAYCRRTRDFLVENEVSLSMIDIIPQAFPDPPDLSRDRTYRQDDTVKFVYIGYLRPEKNLLCFIQVFNRFSAQHRAELSIVGSGPLEERLREIAGDSIRFYGYLTGEEKYRVLLDSDVLVLPSLREPWGFTVNEAVYYGLPVMVSSVAGAKDMVDKNGVLIDPLSEKSMEEALVFFSDAPGDFQNLSQHSREIYRRYTIDKARDCIEESIKSI